MSVFLRVASNQSKLPVLQSSIRNSYYRLFSVFLASLLPVLRVHKPMLFPVCIN